jgi:hypothetical protein
VEVVGVLFWLPALLLSLLLLSAVRALFLVGVSSRPVTGGVSTLTVPNGELLWLVRLLLMLRSRWLLLATLRAPLASLTLTTRCMERGEKSKRGFGARFVKFEGERP